MQNLVGGGVGANKVHYGRYASGVWRIVGHVAHTQAPGTWEVNTVFSFNLACGKLPTFPFNPLDPKIKIWILIRCSLVISYRSSGEKLIK